MILIPFFQGEFGKEIIGHMETDPGAGHADGQAEDLRGGETFPRVTHMGKADIRDPCGEAGGDLGGAQKGSPGMVGDLDLSCQLLVQLLYILIHDDRMRVHRREVVGEFQFYDLCGMGERRNKKHGHNDTHDP